MKNNTKAQIQFSDLIGPSSETPISLLFSCTDFCCVSESEHKANWIKSLGKRIQMEQYDVINKSRLWRHSLWVHLKLQRKPFIIEWKTGVPGVKTIQGSLLTVALDKRWCLRWELKPLSTFKPFGVTVSKVQIHLRSATGKADDSATCSRIVTFMLVGSWPGWL